MTIRKIGVIWGLGLGLGLMCASWAHAMGPVNGVDPSIRAQRDLLDASFFGRPYPYGYTGWGPCIRYVEVDTRWGPRLRRVRVCR
jgi:hypothetical protein